MYKITRTNLIVDGLIISFCLVSVWVSRNNQEPASQLGPFYLMVLAGGVFLFRLSYIAYAYFYGVNKPKFESKFFTVLRIYITFGAILSICFYFVFLAIFAL